VKTNRFDIGIIGAGPAGSSAAISLARKGYSVVLVDKSTFPRSKLCGDFLNPISWPLFERLGVAEELLSLKHEEITGFRISCFTGEEASFPFPHHHGQPLYGLGLNRLYLDHLLLKRAEREGATVLEGKKVRDLSNEGGQWTISLTDPWGDETLHSAFLIGADGRNSVVAERLGLAGPRKKIGSFLGFQLHLRGVQRMNGQVQIHLFPGGYAGLAGVGGGITNLCFALEKRRVKDHSAIESILENCLYQNPHLKIALKESQRISETQSTYPIHTRRRRSSGDGFVLLGDAAYAPEPVTGEGVYFALMSANLASEVIHQAFVKGDFSTNQTARYETVCKKSLWWRERLNTLNRGLVYRPYLLRSLVRLSSKTSFPIGPLIHFVVKTNPQLSQNP
jgi:geranylgeranyl reductase family protein